MENTLKKVARKLVLMEQDLERSEEKVELSERFVCVFLAFLLTKSIFEFQLQLFCIFVCLLNTLN